MTGPSGRPTEKKQRDFSQVEFFSWEEGLCVQCMHIGPYDDEPATVAAMEEYARDRAMGWISARAGSTTRSI